VKPLGELERAVMEAVWAADSPVSVRDVLERLGERQPAYTTVMTVLDRLAGKGTVRRELVGKAWRYTATASREEFITRLMLDVLDLAGSRDAALVHFARSVTAEEARTLRTALANQDAGKAHRPGTDQEPTG
jgi:predicted transcriptional regulator